MSWEDDLASGRGPAPARPLSSAGRRVVDSVEEDDPFSNATRGGAAISRGSSSSMSSRDRTDDLDAILSDPLMKPPMFSGPALSNAINNARAMKGERDQLRAALWQTQHEDQARRAAIQAAKGGEMEAAEQALAAANTPPSKRRGAGNAPLIEPLPPLPTLTELQQELLAQVAQHDPPQKVVEFAPLEERLQTWFDSHIDLGEEQLEGQIKVLLNQYRETREGAARDSKRVWTTNQHLHQMSMKLASIAKLKDFDALADPSAAASAATPLPSDPSTHFYDLHTLDLDSYADIKHLHRSSIAADGSVGTGWWRTQLREMDEDISEKRRRDKQLLEEIENPRTDDGYEVPSTDAVGPRSQRTPLAMDRLNGGGVSRAAQRAVARESLEHGSGLLLARNYLQDESELEADLLASDLRASGITRDNAAHPTQAQLLARTQGRSYRTSSTATEVMLPQGQRILRANNSSKLRDDDYPAGGSRTPPTKARALHDMETALEEEAKDVHKPARRATQR